MDFAGWKNDCRRLRNAAPMEWNDFLLRFKEYTAETVEAVCEAPAEEIMTMKGRAQDCRALCQLFHNLDDVPLPRSPAP